jgi:hypothetical protein
MLSLIAANYLWKPLMDSLLFQPYLRLDIRYSRHISLLFLGCITWVFEDRWDLIAKQLLGYALLLDMSH